MLKKGIILAGISLMLLPAFGQMETLNFNNRCSTTINGVCQEEVKAIIPLPYQPSTGSSFKVVSLKTVNTYKMAQLLQSVGLCSNADYNYGTYNCNTLVPKAKLMIESSSDGNTGRLAIFLEMASEKYVTVDNVIRSVSSATELALSFFPINDRAGFEGRGYSHIGQAQLVSLQIQNGNLSSSSLDFQLLLANEKIAEGQMNKCDVSRCGL
jgi:hypothetical protein